MRHRVNNLDDRFQEVKQKFYYILFGREQAPSRWKNCVTQVNSNMDMAVGSMFVKKYFDENSKNDVSKRLCLRAIYFSLFLKEKNGRNENVFLKNSILLARGGQIFSFSTDIIDDSRDTAIL